jgi:putative spermidine/putrescine transport system permease protein
MTKRTWRGSLFAFGWRHEGAANAALLGLPAIWFLTLYLAAIGALLITAFWQVDDMSGDLIPGFSFSNFAELLSDPIYRTIAIRTIFIASVVTLTDAVLAWPFAYAMVRLSGPRLRAVLMALVLVPLWSSYLARVYAWRLILAHDGVLNWTLSAAGLPDLHIGYSNWAMWIVFSYLWLPFMILPVAAALERIPPSLLEASADLGERGMATFRRVILPMALPGMVAGSDFIGNVVYANVGVTNNIPFAAAYATLPLGVMAVFLLLARKLGAFDAL